MAGSNINGLLVGPISIIIVAQFLQQVAFVEPSVEVLGIDFCGFIVDLLGLLIVAQCSQRVAPANPGIRVPRVDFDGLIVGIKGLLEVAQIIIQCVGLVEPGVKVLGVDVYGFIERL